MFIMKSLLVTGALTVAAALAGPNLAPAAPAANCGGPCGACCDDCDQCCDDCGDCGDCGDCEQAADACPKAAPIPCGMKRGACNAG